MFALYVLGFILGCLSIAPMIVRSMSKMSKEERDAAGIKWKEE